MDHAAGTDANQASPVLVAPILPARRSPAKPAGTPMLRIEAAAGDAQPADREGARDVASEPAPAGKPNAQGKGSPKSPWAIMSSASQKVLKVSGAAKAMTGFHNIIDNTASKNVKQRVINQMEWAQDVFRAMEDYTDPAQRSCPQFWVFWLAVINPENTTKKCWDCWMLLLTLVSVFYVPYKAAFMWTVGTVSAFRWTIDIFFYLDTGIQFWTGYTDYQVVGGVERDKSKIARRYLKHGFAIDLIATLPWDLWLQLFLTDLEANRELLSALYLLKLFRVARAPRLIAHISLYLLPTTPTTIINSCKFFLYVIIVAHIMACLFYLVPTFVDCKDTKWFPASSRMLNYSNLDPPWDEWFDEKLDRNEIDPKTGELVSARKSDLTCLPSSWRTVYGLEARDDYGSLTTMTTIGYGDRGPQNTPEIVFVMFAEVFGLCIFALLLQQICELQNAMTAEQKAQNEIKDNLVKFLTMNKVANPLIRKTVDYLIYRTYFKPTSAEHLPYLTDSLQQRIITEIKKPILGSFRLFGRAPQDSLDQSRMQELFSEADADGSGRLDRGEVGRLMHEMGVTMDEKQLDNVMVQLDTEDDGGVDFQDLMTWYYVQKHGRDRIPPCPNFSPPDPEGPENPWDKFNPVKIADKIAQDVENKITDLRGPSGEEPSGASSLSSLPMIVTLEVPVMGKFDLLSSLALQLSEQQYAPTDVIVEKGDYGKVLYLLKQGSALMYDHSTNNHLMPEVVPGFGDDGDNGTMIASTASDPVWGLECVLEADEARLLSDKLNSVTIEACVNTHCECIYIEQEPLMAVMKQWTEGLDAWRSLARATNAKAVNSFQTPYVGETGDIGEGSGFGRDDSSGAARLPAKVDMIAQELVELKSGLDTRLGNIERLLCKLVPEGDGL